ncbi:MAG: L,D-transpeptidase family protein [Rhodospirillaceae bacterium]|nr:L,D-transpeptidase family protein [Rhodospirillaceae bacterium]
MADEDLIVTPDGWLRFAGRRWRCALGRAGIRHDKREGDGATPVGRFPLRRLLYRADRVGRPATALPAAAIAPEDGWCDDAAHPDYNRQVILPFPAGHERLWRDDGLYDLLVVLGHNDDPVIAGAGSAIFLHVARPGYEPTEGCVALDRDDLATLLARVPAGALMRVLATAP